MPEYVGSIHLHSCYSDGSGTVREIAARRLPRGPRLFHPHRPRLAGPRNDGWQGWHDGVLVVTGVEITCPRRSHVVVLDAKNVAGLRFKPLRRLLFDLQNQGATAFVAHAHPAYIMGFSMKAGELLDWDVPGFTGVELWSLMHDICNGLTPWRAPLFLQNWHRYVRGPHPDTLAHWDRTTLQRRFPAIGTLDNHAINVPVIGRQVLPYEEGFRTLRTHVLADELTGRPDDADRILAAICRGRAFIAMDLWADARGFRFEAADAGSAAHHGRRGRLDRPRPSLGPLAGGRAPDAAVRRQARGRGPGHRPGIPRRPARRLPRRGHAQPPPLGLHQPHILEERRRPAAGRRRNGIMTSAAKSVRYCSDSGPGVRHARRPHAGCRHRRGPGPRRPARAARRVSAPSRLPRWVRGPAAGGRGASGWPSGPAARIIEYLSGRRRRFSVPVDLSAVPPFHAKVLRAAGRIPRGRTVTYGELAAAVGRPRGARAVGQAMARNPVPLVVPCHRVVGSGGLGGYGGGLALKRRLLALEGAAITHG